MKRFVKHPNAAQKLALGLRRDFGRNSIAVMVIRWAAIGDKKYFALSPSLDY
jgi:hypothetical protein